MKYSIEVFIAAAEEGDLDRLKRCVVEGININQRGGEILFKGELPNFVSD